MSQYIITTILTVLCCVLGNDEASFNHHIFPCHSTDYVCFKRQYKSLRNHVLLGEKHLSIDIYKPYTFEYGSTGTCISLSGMEDSGLIGMRFDSRVKEFSLLLYLPFTIKQIKNNGHCNKPTHDIGYAEPYNGTLHKFIVNATIGVSFSYEIEISKNETYLDIRKHDLVMRVHISDFRAMKYVDSERHQNYEWAYRALKNFDAAEHLAGPYIYNYRLFTTQVPLSRYIMLYPEERYNDLIIVHDDEYYHLEVCDMFCK